MGVGVIALSLGFRFRGSGCSISGIRVGSVGVDGLRFSLGQFLTRTIFGALYVSNIQRLQLLLSGAVPRTQDSTNVSQAHMRKPAYPTPQNLNFSPVVKPRPENTKTLKHPTQLPESPLDISHPPVPARNPRHRQTIYLRSRKTNAGQFPFHFPLFPI